MLDVSRFVVRALGATIALLLLMLSAAAAVAADGASTRRSGRAASGSSASPAERRASALRSACSAINAEAKARASNLGRRDHRLAWLHAD